MHRVSRSLKTRHGSIGVSVYSESFVNASQRLTVKPKRVKPSHPTGLDQNSRDRVLDWFTRMGEIEDQISTLLLVLIVITARIETVLLIPIQTGVHPGCFEKTSRLRLAVVHFFVQYRTIPTHSQ